MTVKEELKLESITEDYYLCKLYKSGNDVVLSFEDVKLIFENYLILKCGYPNEEIYIHYDYYTQGSMKKHCLYEIQESEWIKELNEMNKVHPRHADEVSKSEKHFIILFEDEVFECIAVSFKVSVPPSQQRLS